MRGRHYRRRLPSSFGRRPIWVTPDARLRFLKPWSLSFDRELLEYVNQFVMPGDVVFDIGANVGEFAVAAAHKVGAAGAVLAIEPDPYLAALLQRTAAEEGNRDITLKSTCAAASATCGIKSFSIASRGRAANALVSVGSTQMGGVRYNILVPTLTIDFLSAHWKVPDVIKIDVEGAEKSVLEGAGELLRTRRPLIIIEVSRSEREVTQLLHEYAYALFDPENVAESAELSACKFNTLAIPKERVKQVSGWAKN